MMGESLVGDNLDSKKKKDLVRPRVTNATLPLL